MRHNPLEDHTPIDIDSFSSGITSMTVSADIHERYAENPQEYHEFCTEFAQQIGNLVRDTIIKQMKGYALRTYRADHYVFDVVTSMDSPHYQQRINAHANVNCLLNQTSVL